MKKLFLIILSFIVITGLAILAVFAWFMPVSKKTSDEQQETATVSAATAETSSYPRVEETSIWFSDEKLADISPLEFINYLKEMQKGSMFVLSAPEGWISEKDADELVKLVDSKEPCASVVSPLSSYLPPSGSTVGNEAMFILDGYKSGNYPPSLCSTIKNDRDPKQYKQWWEKTKSDGIANFYEARQNCRAVYLSDDPQALLGTMSEKNKQKVYPVKAQKEMENFLDGLKRRVALWVDIKTAKYLDKTWLNKKALQERLPVIAAGSSNALYSFRDILGVCTYMHGPYIPVEERNKEGFSVYMFLNQKQTGNSLEVHAVMRGFDGKINGDEILKVSNMLFDEPEVFNYDENSTAEQKARYYYWLLKSYSEDESAQDSLKKLLPDIDWSCVANESVDDFFGIVDWFTQKSLKGDETALKSLLNSRAGLDGAYSEGYFSSLRMIADSKTNMFVNILSQMDAEDIKEIAVLLSPEIKGYKGTVDNLEDYIKTITDPTLKDTAELLLGR